MSRMRAPDFTIGPPDRPYLHRWYLIPRNRFCNVYLHKIMRDDDDRALHDHPWWNVSILLRGAYVEVMPNRSKLRRAGSIVFRKATAAHRLELFGGPCWSLFITGPKVRTWGFYCPKGWIPWQQFVNPNNRGEIGPGCGE